MKLNRVISFSILGRLGSAAVGRFASFIAAIKESHTVCALLALYRNYSYDKAQLCHKNLVFYTLSALPVTEHGH